MSANEREEITIKFKGTKKFKQTLVDRIYELLMEDDLIDQAAKPGCGFTFNSTIAPSEVVDQ